LFRHDDPSLSRNGASGKPGAVQAAVGFGGLLELLQHFSPGRQADWADFAVNSVGALIGLAVAILVRRMLTAFARLIFYTRVVAIRLWTGEIVNNGRIQIP